MGVCGNRLKKRRRVGRFLGVSFFRVDTPPNVDVPKEIKLTAAAAAEHPDFSSPPPYKKSAMSEEHFFLTREQNAEAIFLFITLFFAEQSSYGLARQAHILLKHASTVICF